ncbi:MAG: biopolymer transporter ExbD [Flavobacteriales bacterium]|jgi:biopolymer transport protein ExbD|nr:biopolymer transporter ExbD [Flavobacteriales bacterium]
MDTLRTTRRSQDAINAGSMADIAFLLLIFFLVTTTMDIEQGLLRRLPPVADAPATPAAARNVFQVHINAAGELLLGNERVELDELRERAVEFLTNPEGRSDLPTMRPITEAICREQIAAQVPGPVRELWQQRLATVRMIGSYVEPPAEAQMIIQTAPLTQYAQYVRVQDVLEGAVVSVRDVIAQRAFGKPFKELQPHDPKDRERMVALQRAVPLRLGDADLKDF